MHCSALLDGPAQTYPEASFGQVGTAMLGASRRGVGSLS